MNKIILVFIGIFLLFALCAFADMYIIDKPATLFAICKNYTYTNSTASITIYFPNMSAVVVNKPMTNMSTGKFNYTFVPSIEGSYLSTVTCNIGGVLGYAEQGFNVEGETKMIGAGLADIGKIIFVILMFALHFGLLWAGLRFRIQTVLFMSGVFGIVASLTAIGGLGSLYSLGAIAVSFFVAYALISTGFCSIQIYNRYKE